MEVSKPAEHDRILKDKESIVDNSTDPGISIQTVSDSLSEVPETIIEKVEEINRIPSYKKNPLEDSCDVVYMVTGERINAIVIEIGEDYVHYKKCDDLKGRLFTVKTKHIDNITLRNGEYFIPKDRIVFDKERERKKSQAVFVMSIIAVALAFICFVFSFFISPFSGLALTFGAIDMLFSFILMLINIRPTRFTPSHRTRFAWIFLAIAILLLIVAFIIVFI